MQLFDYKNPDTGKIEKVQQEKWCWEVTYLNEHILKQFDPSDNSFHRFAEIDLTQVHVFRMVNRDDPKKSYQILINPAYMKPIHFYRNLKTIITNLQSGEVQNELFSRAYVFGYETTEHLVIKDDKGNDITSQFQLKNTVKKTYFILMPDDNVIITDDVDKIQIEHV